MWIYYATIWKIESHFNSIRIVHCNYVFTVLYNYSIIIWSLQWHWNKLFAIFNLVIWKRSIINKIDFQYTSSPVLIIFASQVSDSLALIYRRWVLMWEIWTNDQLYSWFIDIAAYPDSVNVLANIQNDVRTPDKLIDGVNSTTDGRHMWLAPFLPITVT